MAQITFILQVPGSSPARRVENVDDAKVTRFLDDLIATQYGPMSRDEAAQKFIDGVFDDLNLTSRSARRRVEDVEGILD